MARQEQRSPGRGLDRPIPHTEVDADSVGVESGVAPRSIVIHAVDAAEHGRRSIDEGRHRILVTDVASQTEGAPTGVRDVPRHGGGRPISHVADRHRGALLGEQHRGDTTDVGGSAAHEHDLAVELTHDQLCSQNRAARQGALVAQDVRIIASS